MKIWNLNVKRGADGSKHLDIQMHGVIDGGWLDDGGIDSAACVAELQQHLDAKTIGVRINSVGGSAFGGVALYNALQSHPGEVTCIVEGLAASAASLVAMAGKCVMGTGAMMMIHKPATVAMGNADDLRKSADMLDKVQDALASIYTAKTGMGLDDVNALLDDETWMNAEEAVSAGFADAVENHAADGDPEPDEDDPNEGNEGETENAAPTMTDAGVVWAGVTFPVAALPQRIAAMARKPAPPAIATVAQTQPLAIPSVITSDSSTPPTLSVVPSQTAAPAPVVALEPPITREVLARRSPELLAALLEEGRAAGVAAERARLQAIDELGVTGAVDLVAAAKYGEKPTDAPTLAMAVIKAGKVAGSELLAMRKKESEALAAVATGGPQISNAAADEARVIQAIAAGGNARRGGNVR